MFKGAFHQGFRRGMTVLFQQLFVQAAAVDTDADGDLPILTHIHHRFDPVFASDITGVDTDLGCTALCGCDGQLIVKMDIRHQG